MRGICGRRMVGCVSRFANGVRRGGRGRGMWGRDVGKMGLEGFG